MKTGMQDRPRKIGRAVGLALAAALAVFVLSPGAALAAGGTITQTANTDCSGGTFEWVVDATGFAADETVLIEATFGADYNGQFVTASSAGTASAVVSFTGVSTSTLSVTVSDGTMTPVWTGSATPNCGSTATTPTAKSQCSGSGWMAFPGMKNRGQCNASVAGGGKSK